MKRTSSAIQVLIYIGALLLFARQSPAAPGANDSRQRPDVAQTRVTEARQAWAKEQQELSRAQLAYQSASNKVQAARQTALQQQAAKLGLTAAFLERDTALRQLQKRRTTLEGEIKLREEYQQAVKDTDEARKRLSEVSQDQSLLSDQRQKLAADLNAKIRRPSEIRKQAEGNDPGIQQALQRWQSAVKKVSELQAQVKMAVDSDPRVTEASEQEKAIALDLANARKSLTQAEQEFATAQANLSRQSQAMQRPMVQDPAVTPRPSRYGR